MSYKIQKISQQLDNIYYPLGQKGDEYGGNAEQESEAAEEINEDMEVRDQENYTPGNDNLVINKNDNPGDKFSYIIYNLEKLAILVKTCYARDLITTTIDKLKRKE